MSARASGRIVPSFVLSFAVLAGAPTLANDSESPSEFRRSAASTASLPQEEFGLSIAWDRELGSGYSNISVVDGKAVTGFTAGEVDVLAAFDRGSGEEIWRYELGPKYTGHSGSDDGPLSTPAISGDRVFALSGHGLLVSLDFESGREIWSRQLDESSSTRPYYGYSTSPVTVGDLVVLATGGEGRAVTAFDRASGEVRWTAGSDSVRYQTPLVTELNGRPTIVAVTDNQVLGIAPESGEVLFELLHGWDGRTSESAQATSIDGERFFVNSFDGSALYRLADGGVAEVWRSRAFGNSVAIPVLHEGHLYGFTGRFLTCAAVDSGEIVWRSRPPGALGISLVGDKLAIIAQSGHLVLADASPEGYREITRIATFERGDYATPTFVDDHFLVRNLERLAAVRVDTSATPQHAQVEVEVAGHLLGELKSWAVATLELPESARQAAVDARFADIEASPFFEDGGIAHFFWRGEAEDVGVESQEIAPGDDNALHRIPGTDLYLRSAELDSAAQYTYTLTIDYDEETLDPRNDYVVDNGFDQVSEVRMPDWPQSPHLEPPAEDAPRGELDTFQFRSEVLDNARQIQVWRPPGYGSDPETRYPVLVVNHGDNLLRGGLMRNTLDNLVGKEVAPLVAVFVPRASGPEYGGEQVDDYVRFLVEELLPHVDRHYLTDGENRAIMGPGSAGVTAVYAALQRADVFQRAAAQSFYPIEASYERIEEMISTADLQPELIALVWSTRDYELGEGQTAEAASQALAEQLRARNIPLREQISAYSPGWGGWRGQHDDLLAALFPMEREGDE